MLLILWERNSWLMKMHYYHRTFVTKSQRSFVPRMDTIMLMEFTPSTINSRFVIFVKLHPLFDFNFFDKLKIRLWRNGRKNLRREIFRKLCSRRCKPCLLAGNKRVLLPLNRFEARFGNRERPGEKSSYFGWTKSPFPGERIHEKVSCWKSIDVSLSFHDFTCPDCNTLRDRILHYRKYSVDLLLKNQVIFITIIFLNIQNFQKYLNNIF